MLHSFEEQNLLGLRLLLENSASAIENSLQNFAKLPGFNEQMMLAFGDDIDVHWLKEKWRSHNFTFPNIEVVSNNTINGANGAFSSDTNTIYLSAEFLTTNQSNLDVVNSLLLEEYGHYLDNEFNSVDSPGDEGAIFSAVVRGEKLTDNDLQQLRNEDDSAVVSIDGEEVAIEQNELIVESLFGSVGTIFRILDEVPFDSDNYVDSGEFAKRSTVFVSGSNHALYFGGEDGAHIEDVGIIEFPLPNPETITPNTEVILRLYDAGRKFTDDPRDAPPPPPTDNQIIVSGYIGDGEVTISDRNINATQITTISTIGGVDPDPFDTLYPVNVTDFVVNAINSGEEFVGFRLDTNEASTYEAFKAGPNGTLPRYTLIFQESTNQPRIFFKENVSRVEEGDSAILTLTREGDLNTEETVEVQLKNPFLNINEPNDLENLQNIAASQLIGLLGSVATTVPGNIASLILGLVTGIVTADTAQRQAIYENSVADNDDFGVLSVNGDSFFSDFPVEVTFAPSESEATLEINTFDDSFVECTHGTLLEIPNQDSSLFIIDDNEEIDARFFAREVLKSLFSKANLATVGVGVVTGLLTGGISLVGLGIGIVGSVGTSVLTRIIACENGSEGLNNYAELLQGISPINASQVFSTSSVDLTSTSNNLLLSESDRSTEIEIPVNFVPTINNDNGNFVIQTDENQLFLVTDFVSEEQFSSQLIQLEQITDINNNNQIVGSSISGEQASAAVWSEGTVTSIAINSQSVATAINDAGQITINSVNDDGIAEPYIYELATDEFMPIANSESSTKNGGLFVVDVNNNGEVLGYGATAEGNLEAFIWRDNSIEFIGTLGGAVSIPIAINDAGDVIGVSEIENSEQLTGFIYRDGTINNLDAGQGLITLPQAFNENGEVVGIYAPIEGELDANASSAFIWREGEFSDLGSLGGASTIPVDINEQGQVIALSEDASEQIESVLWDSGNFEILEDIAVSFDGEGNTIDLINRVDEDNLSDDLGSTVYRFFNPDAGVHFYTASEVERDVVLELPNYTFEGESYNTVDPLSGEAEDVYRFFNTNTGVHLYTTDENERDFIIENLADFTFEETAFSAYETEIEGAIPIHRFYEPSIGVHFYTPNETERMFVEDNLSNYTYEGIAYYAFSLDGTV